MRAAVKRSAFYCFCAFCETLTTNLHFLHKKYAPIYTDYHKLYLSLHRQTSVRTESPHTIITNSTAKASGYDKDPESHTEDLTTLRAVELFYICLCYG